MMVWRPHRKVLVAGTAGPSLAVILAWIGSVFVDIPAPVAAAAASLLTAGLAYLVSPAPEDRIPGDGAGPDSAYEIDPGGKHYRPPDDRGDPHGIQ